MASSHDSIAALRTEINQLLDQLPHLNHSELIQQALLTITTLADQKTDRLDWKILNGSLQDMARAFDVFYPHRHVRKITIFGSARIPPDSPDYRMAMAFAQRVTQLGFMVMTGAGGGIMQAGNKGAGPGNSFGLNIQLPFEQGANPFVTDSQYLVQFKYFFTRKLFFLRESDALALFPGGFGTQDEAFESLTLIQTGKSGLVPVVMIDHPGGDYWQSWDRYIRQQLVRQGLVSADDPSLYVITNDLDVACEAITHFYRVYHSSRFVGEQLVIRLNSHLPEGAVETLHKNFSDLLIPGGKMERASALPAESRDGTEHMPRLVMDFNQRDYGRLYQFIGALNDYGDRTAVTYHPEQK